MTNEDRLPDRPFTTAQLAELGLTRATLRRLLRDGSVRRGLQGVCVPSSLGDSPSLRAACAALVLPPHSVVCDRGAAWLLGIDTYEPDALDIEPRLDVVALNGNDRTRRPELLGGRRTLQPDEVIELHGIRLTSPLRTACDIACLRGRHRALATLDAFRREFGLTHQEFLEFLPRFRGRRGCRQLRELVGYADPRAESPGESWTRLEIIDAGLPAPDLQVWVDVPGWGEARLDHAYEHMKIAVEFDGQEFHGEEHRERDEARRAALRRDGWIVIVVTKSDFRTDRLLAWTGELAAALRERAGSHRRQYSRGPAYRH